MIYLTFNGPLISATTILVCSLILLHDFTKYYTLSTKSSTFHRVIDSFRSIPKVELLIYTTFILLSLYSIYIGRFNSANFTNPVPLSKRYYLLLIGIFNYFTKSIGPILLISAIVANSIIIKNLWNSPEAKPLIKQIKWISLLILSTFYFFLLVDIESIALT
mgnify:CR=1 FL=1